VKILGKAKAFFNEKPSEHAAELANIEFELQRIAEVDGGDVVPTHVGPFSSLRRLNFEGNKTFAPEKLRSGFDCKIPASFWPPIPQQPWQNTKRSSPSAWNGATGIQDFLVLVSWRPAMCRARMPGSYLSLMKVHAVAMDPSW